jgi:hypothetical protein
MEARNAEAVEVIDRLSHPDRFLSVGDSLGKLATFAEHIPQHAASQDCREGRRR